MTHKELKILIGKVKTIRLQARLKNDYIRADSLSHKLRLLKKKLKSLHR